MQDLPYQQENSTCFVLASCYSFSSTETVPKEAKNNNAPNQEGSKNEALTFTFKELAVATKNFRPECMLGEGGFGRVYKGYLEKTGQVFQYFWQFVACQALCLSLIIHLMQ